MSVFLVFLLLACGYTSPTPTDTAFPSTPPSLEEPSTPETNEPNVVTAPSNLNARLIAQVANDDGSPRPVLRNAQWTDDGSSIIYTLSTLNGERRFAFDLESGETLSLSATTPTEDNSHLISPSGRYELVVDFSNFPTPEPSNPVPPFELWMVDNSNGERILLLAEAIGRTDVNWASDEKVFVLSLSAFSHVTMYIGDTATIQMTPLHELADHSERAYYGWTLSPDGSKLSIASSDFTQMQIINLEDGSSEFAESGNAAFFYWTPDSQRVYYKALSPKSGLEFDGYYIYDTVAQEGELLLTQVMLIADGLCLKSCYFVPSPNGSQTLVGWGDYTHDYLWLIDFP